MTYKREPAAESAKKIAIIFEASIACNDGELSDEEFEQFVGDFTAIIRKAYAEQEKEIATLRAAIATPEVYVGVITKVVEDERDEALKQLVKYQRREWQLIEAAELAKDALGHDVPENCWATGPCTSPDPSGIYEDLIVCPGCRAIAAIKDAIAAAKKEQFNG